ncbi:cytochrome-c oxidase [Breoghania sp. L-A4]|uniref:cytochrome-c oxidase n=1 Tax=Breoghania sp. L-A4 TaxID=2304600 RepID=UPI000E35C9CD|nr:cytochrome-c oxidase [Breoghania sp. L-A4]AXS41384.1 cytochrome-c oxidase [Breoghania sp. L-A4]
MSLFSQITAKPWTQAQALIDNAHTGPTFALPRASLGLRVFLGVVTVLFVLLITAYGARMVQEDWRPTPPISLLWTNTVLLILGSGALQLALIGSETGRTHWLNRGVAFGGIFTLAFLGGQIVAWNQLSTLPAFEVTNPAIAFFYMITIAHALHMGGGMVALGRVTTRLWREGDTEEVQGSLGRCALYWHTLLIIWLVLFGLLFSGNENLGFLLTLCGLR